MNETDQPATDPAPPRRPFRRDTIFLQWIRLPLLIALALVAAKAIQRPFEGHGFAQVVTIKANSDVADSLVEEAVEAPPEPISTLIDEPIAPDLVAASTPPVNPEEAAESLGATVRFLRVAFRGSLQQLTQSGSQASYPLLQIKDWWLPTADRSPHADPQGVAAQTDQGGATPVLAGAETGDPPATSNAVSASALVLANPASNLGAIQFMVDGVVVSLEPGAVREFTAGERTVQFHRGSQFGNAQYSVARGVHVFEVTARGWRLTPYDSLPNDVNSVESP
jgi:hypothetical protein